MCKALSRVLRNRGAPGSPLSSWSLQSPEPSRVPPLPSLLFLLLPLPQGWATQGLSDQCISCHLAIWHLCIFAFFIL